MGVTYLASAGAAIGYMQWWPLVAGLVADVGGPPDGAGTATSIATREHVMRQARCVHRPLRRHHAACRCPLLMTFCADSRRLAWLLDSSS